KLRLRLGLTDYRTFRGTNWSPSAARLAADSARDHPWLEAAYLSQKLGVGAVVETSDGFLLSLCRSSGVAEGQGMMGAPGGHPEPEVARAYAGGPPEPVDEGGVEPPQGGAAGRRRAVRQRRPGSRGRDERAPGGPGRAAAVGGGAPGQQLRGSDGGVHHPVHPHARRGGGALRQGRQGGVREHRSPDHSRVG
ncbi:unnamed protein product, partial [Ectocarpus fasciculatus]